ncbi:hypothetical protein IV47_GL001391 [Lactobacillus delbrueckii subsp. bulgaricus ATCC 11842 = JCM 1002]|nr:hypothetical protein IV47_GL001391 [Lactobacillus delbrueckii subsp. bulgaricus ATCC 11842 = JCM 1002]
MLPKKADSIVRIKRRLTQVNRLLLLISQDFTTQAIRMTDFLPAVFILCMTFDFPEMRGSQL